MRVHVGRALAGEVGQEQEPVGAGRHGSGLLQQRRERIAVAGVERGDLVAVPGQSTARGQDDAHQVVAAGNRGAERVERTLGVDARRRAVHEQGARGADRADAMPVLDQAGADRGAGIVAAAGDHGRAGRQAGRGGSLGGQPAGDLGPLEHPRQQVRRHLQGGQDLDAVVAAGEVEEQGAGRVRGVGRVLAGEPQADEVLGQEQLGDPGGGVGLLVAQPQQLGRLHPGAGAVAGDRDQPLAPEPALDLGAFGVGAGVVPQQGRADRRALAVEEHRAVHLAGEADPGEVVSGEMWGEFAQHGDRRGPPGLWLLLGPAGAGGEQRVGAVGAGEHGAVCRQNDALGTTGADVDADGDSRSGHVPSSPLSRRSRLALRENAPPL